MKKNGLLTITLVSVLLVSLSCGCASKQEGTESPAEAPGRSAVLSGGILIRGGIPLATQSAADLTLWQNSNAAAQRELSSTGRIVVLSNGERVQAYAAEGAATRIKTNLGTSGWVPTLTVH